MIKILGKKRVLTLLLLVVLNAALIAAFYAYLVPHKEEKDRELRVVRGQVSSTRADIERLRVELQQIEYQKDDFEALQKDGFFTKQNRRDAKIVLEQIQQESGVISAVASIESGEFVEDQEAAKAEYKILLSEMNIDIKALRDVEIFKYISLLEDFFPGDLTVKKVTLSREEDLSATILRAIAASENMPLVEAQIQLQWRTMVPMSEILNEEGTR